MDSSSFPLVMAFRHLTRYQTNALYDAMSMRKKIILPIAAFLR
jgi:hypothetical protein